MDMAYLILDMRLLDIQPQCQLDMRSTMLVHIFVGKLSKLLEIFGSVDSGCRICDIGFWTLDIGHWVRVVGVGCRV